MRVLIGCEFSGIVRDEFLKKGHDAWSCDLEPSDHKNHIQDNVLNHLDDGWDLLIAHPPCTYIANSGCRWLKNNPTRWVKLKEAVKLFNKLLNCNIPKRCIENPKPYSYAFLEPHSQIIQPYEFGDPFTKATFLWLRRLPPLKPTDISKLRIPEVDMMYDSSKEIRGHIRSITYPGIAKAMAEQWG